MPKQERNKQFVGIEEKICTDLSVRGLSTEKEQIHFDEFGELKETTRLIAQSRGLSLAEWYRWLNYRYLSIHKFIPVEVEKREESSLDFTESKPAYKVPPHLNGKRNWLKYFGTDFQQKILNQGELNG
jgi:hypothetical protein